MAAKTKKKYPDIVLITQALELTWEKEPGTPYEPEEIGECNFCGKGIYDTEDYFLATASMPDEYVAQYTACLACAKRAGLQW